jgi:hypothetical protein
MGYFIAWFPKLVSNRGNREREGWHGFHPTRFGETYPTGWKTRVSKYKNMATKNGSSLVRSYVFISRDCRKERQWEKIGWKQGSSAYIGPMKKKRHNGTELLKWETLCVCWYCVCCARTLSNVQSHYYVFSPSPLRDNVSPLSSSAC